MIIFKNRRFGDFLFDVFFDFFAVVVGIFDGILVIFVHTLCAVSFGKKKVYASVAVDAVIFDVTLAVRIAIDACCHKVALAKFHPNWPSRPTPCAVV